MIWRWYALTLALPLADGILTLLLAFAYGGEMELSVPVMSIRFVFSGGWLLMAILLFAPLQSWFRGKGDAAAARRRLQVLGPLTTWFFIVDYALYHVILSVVLPYFDIDVFTHNKLDLWISQIARVAFLGYLVHVLVDSYVTHVRSQYFKEFRLVDEQDAIKGKLVRRIMVILLVTAFCPLGYLVINILTAPPEDMLRRGLAIGVSGIIAVIVAAGIGGSRIYFPLARLMQGLWAVQQGRIDVRVPITTNDEIGLLTSAFNEMLLRIRRQEFLRGRLGQYLREESFLNLQKEEEPLAPVAAEGSLMLVDIDGFSKATGHLDQRQRAKLVRDWRHLVVQIAKAHDGVPVSLTADRMLISFGLPVQAPDWKKKALAAALSLMKELEHHRFEGDMALKARVRLHAGHMTGGVVGARDSLSYEILGTVADTVRRLDWHPSGRKDPLLVTEAALPDNLSGIDLRRLGLLPLGFSGAQQPVYAVTRNSLGVN